MSTLASLLAGVALSIIVGLAAGSRVAGALRVRPAVAWGLIVTLGIVLSATLAPAGNPGGYPLPGAPRCDFARFWPAPPDDLIPIDDTILNILLFVPLGAAVGVMPRSRGKAAIIAAAVLLPFAIEAIQVLAPVLDRRCESADVVDNLSGLAIGLVLGSVAGRLAGPGRLGA